MTLTGISIRLLAFLSLLVGIFFCFNRTTGAVQSGGRRRSYLLYVPESYHPDRPTPLVISIHGFVQWPAHQRGLSGWNRLADEHGFLVVYPRGSGFPLHWNAGPISKDKGKSQGEVDFFVDLLDHLSHRYNIDPQRIYANGMSNGAGMTHLLACELPDRIVAFGGVAGAYLYPEHLCQPAYPIPWIVFHGQDDPVVPFQGGSSSVHQGRIRFPSIEAWVKMWAEHNGCESHPQIEQITPEITRLMYSRCEDDVEVVLYAIEGGGHTWPGGGWLPVWLTGKTNRDIDATALMWEFFDRYSSDP